ncbi:sensor histidine kinase [uncultured Amnibacterium sp.]|uniref:sensor histidine kinase n=1 Tax=uncultured Amnibacterium sp. TaxID=1631851 RepID=UPI0035CC1236
MAPRRQDRFTRAVSAALSAAAFTFALSTLLFAWSTSAAALVGVNGVLGVLLPGIGTLLTALGGLLLAVRAPRPLRFWKVAAGLAVMEAGFAVYLVSYRPLASGHPTTAGFALSLMKIAMIAFCANAGRRWGPPVAAFVAQGVSALISAIVGPMVGVAYAPDGPASFALIFVILVSVGFAIARARGAVANRVVEALRDEDAVRVARGAVRSRAAAVVHDTVLNDLAVIATSEPGRMTPRLMERLQATLDLLNSADWVGAPDAPPEQGAPGATLQRAIDHVRASGLTVVLNGDMRAVAALDPGVEHALGRAVEQCLVNTLTHAGTAQAELTVIAEENDVTVMVADNGAGFDMNEVDEDRMGLRRSVQGRIREVGGTVRIFATPGVGTTILMSVPRATAERPIGVEA